MQKRTLTLVGIVVIAAIAIFVGVFIYIKYSASKPAGTAISVLFVGNSLTYENDLPKTVSEIARSLGDKVEYDMSAPGGYTLMQHAQDKTTLDKIKLRPWNYVVLQEQSELPALADSRVDEQVIPYATELDNLIHSSEPLTKTVFFETWGYKDGDSGYCAAAPTLCNYAVMQDQLSKSYNLLAQKTGGLLAPVGEAWRLAQQTHPEIELYQTDGKHPSAEGTYLAACVFYMTLFNKNVTGASRLSLSSSRAKILQQIAEQAVLGSDGRNP
jgi:hypothetical protein